jgi:hypothetical protein
MANSGSQQNRFKRLWEIPKREASLAGFHKDEGT